MVKRIVPCSRFYVITDLALRPPAPTSRQALTTACGEGFLERSTAKIPRVQLAKRRECATRRGLLELLHFAEELSPA